jgi:hypothetical protein
MLQQQHLFGFAQQGLSPEGFLQKPSPLVLQVRA